MARKMLPKLTSDYIFDYVSQESIFAEYLHISISDIDYCINTGKLIQAPYREDNNNSFGFKYDSKGKLRGRDFGGYFWGDCFDAVGFNLHLNPKIKGDFGKIIHHVAKTFGIHKYKKDKKNVSKITKLARKQTHKPILQIDLLARDWNKYDAHYWYYKYNINKETLNTFNVIPVYSVYFNNKQVYEYTDQNDPCYAYYLGTKNNIKRYKLYFPLRKENKFFGNSNIVQGIRQIKKADFGVITKSLKDVMCLHTLGIQSIAPYSETQLLTQTQYNYIKSKWNFIITLTDFDLTGIRFGCNMRRKYGSYPIWLTNGKLSTINFGAKDISDYIDKYKYEQAQLLVDNYIDNDFEIDYNFINSLKHY